MSGAIGGRRDAELPAEARREGAEAPEADRETDVRDRAVGVPEKLRRTFEPTVQQVLMRRLAELALELAAEVGWREPRRAGERRDVERLAVTRVHQVFRAQEVPPRRDRRDRHDGR